ncbi:MAG TPA: hypothetical protein VKZ65_06575 [Glycomyces sp.]|nr:hypothetical protein [Glycomyces sp.]
MQHVGQLLVAFALRRFDRFRTLALLWGVGAVGAWVAAALSPGFAGLLALVFLLGLALPGANGALQAIGALAFPPRARATGMGWTRAMGRVGTLASGLAGGLVVGVGWTLGTIFFALGGPQPRGLRRGETKGGRSSRSPGRSSASWGRTGSG